MNWSQADEVDQVKRFDRVLLEIGRRVVDGDRGPREYPTVTLARTYRDSRGEWQRSGTFDARDLPDLEVAIRWAVQELLLNRCGHNGRCGRREGSHGAYISFIAGSARPRRYASMRT